MGIKGTRDENVLLIIVRARKGMSSCFVRRIDADEPERAERRARWRGARGTWRLMVLAGAADRMAYSSKMVS